MPIAVTLICRKCLLLDLKLLHFKTNSKILKFPYAVGMLQLVSGKNSSSIIIRLSLTMECRDEDYSHLE